MKTLKQSAAKAKCFVSSPTLFVCFTVIVVVRNQRKSECFGSQSVLAGVAQFLRVSALDLGHAEGCRFESRSTWELY